MKDLRLKLKRQTEIIGLVLSNPCKYRIVDLEVLFDLQASTLKRDLQEIRSWGIDIHSAGKNGLEINSKIPTEILKEILPQYMGIAVSKSSHDAAINLMVRKLKEKSVEYVVSIQLAIEKNKKVKIKYQKEDVGKAEIREIEPYCLFQSDKAWRLLANHNGTIKQFLISRIKKVEGMDSNFTPLSQDKLDEIFKTSFKSWLGNQRFTVKLKLLFPWTKRLSDAQLMEFQEITKNEDGSVIYETTVNSIDEIASWIVSRGKGIIVLEPESLKKKVIELAKGVLENYS